jgi:hypothetical protein
MQKKQIGLLAQLVPQNAKTTIKEIAANDMALIITNMVIRAGEDTNSLSRQRPSAELREKKKKKKKQYNNQKNEHEKKTLSPKEMCRFQGGLHNTISRQNGNKLHQITR